MNVPGVVQVTHFPVSNARTIEQAVVATRLAVDVVHGEDVGAQVVFHGGAVRAVRAGVGLLACVGAQVACEALLAGTAAEHLAADGTRHGGFGRGETRRPAATPR